MESATTPTSLVVCLRDLDLRHHMAVVTTGRFITTSMLYLPPPTFADAYWDGSRGRGWDDIEDDADGLPTKIPDAMYDEQIFQWVAELRLRSGVLVVLMRSEHDWARAVAALRLHGAIVDDAADALSQQQRNLPPVSRLMVSTAHHEPPYREDLYGWIQSAKQGPLVERNAAESPLVNLLAAIENGTARSLTEFALRVPLRCLPFVHLYSLDHVDAWRSALSDSIASYDDCVVSVAEEAASLSSRSGAEAFLKMAERRLIGELSELERRVEEHSLMRSTRELLPDLARVGAEIVLVLAAGAANPILALTSATGIAAAEGLGAAVRILTRMERDERLLLIESTQPMYWVAELRKADSAT